MQKPSLTVLQHRGMPISSTCSLCNLEEESTNHLFITYPFIQALWFGGYLSVKSEYFQLPNIIQCFGNFLENSNHDLVAISNLVCLVAVLLYVIWYTRNMVEFQLHIPNVHQAIILFNSWSC